MHLPFLQAHSSSHTPTVATRVQLSVSQALSMIELTDENTLYGESGKSEWEIVKLTFVLCIPKRLALDLILTSLLVFILTGNS